MALTIEAHNNKQSVSQISTLASTGITASNNDLIIIASYNENAASPHRTISSISKTSGTGTVGTFTKRQATYLDNVIGTGNGGGGPAAYGGLEIWSAPVTSALTTAVFTVTYSGNYDTATLEVFAIKYDGVSVPVWTSNGPFTGTTGTTTATTPSVSSIKTSNPSIVFGFAGEPDNLFASLTAGSGYTIIEDSGNGAGTLGSQIVTEDQSFATSQSSLTVTYGSGTWKAWIMIGDAVENPGATDTLYAAITC